MPELRLASSLLLVQQFHFTPKQNLHAEHTKREDQRTSEPVHSPVTQKAQAQAPALLYFHTADEQPKHSATVCLFLAL